MNLDQLQQKLLAAARVNPPPDHVPLAFEKRVLARLAAKPVSDWSALWSRALWRATVPCLAVTILLMSWSFLGNNPTTETSVPNAVALGAPDDLSAVFEETLLASSEPLTSYDFLEETW